MSGLLGGWFSRRSRKKGGNGKLQGMFAYSGFSSYPPPHIWFCRVLCVLVIVISVDFFFFLDVANMIIN